MFKLTKQEQLIVVFVISALVLGTLVREWRGHAMTPSPTTVTENRDK